MESLGEILKLEREKAGYSIDQIARETNIAKRYLEALEEENFEVFPGETYLKGFLKTYSEYLGLNSPKMITLYKHHVIQEQPIPMDGLIEKKSIDFKLLGYIAGAGAFLLIIIISIIAGVSKKPDEKTDQEFEPKTFFENPAVSGNTIELLDEIMEQRFSEGDTILIPANNSKHPIKISKIADDLTLELSGVITKLKLGSERLFDLNSDGIGDIKVVLRDIDISDSNKGVVLRFDKSTLGPNVSIQPNTQPEETMEALKPAEAEKAPLVIGTSNAASRKQSPSVIMEADKADPFTLSITFKGLCLFRFMNDNKEREERYFHKKEEFRIDVNKQITVWVSNAGAIMARIGGNEIYFGKQGEVAAKMIKWEYDATKGKYNLKLIPVY